MSEVADLAADLRGEVGLDVLGASSLLEGVLSLAVGDDELQAIVDVVDAGRLLRRAEGEHGLIDGWGPCREIGDAVADCELDRQPAQVRAGSRMPG